MESYPHNTAVITFTIAKPVFLIYIVSAVTSLRHTLFYMRQHEKFILAQNFDFIKQMLCNFWGVPSDVVVYRM
jgi:hypothetical protein